MSYVSKYIEHNATYAMLNGAFSLTYEILNCYSQYNCVMNIYNKTTKYKNSVKDERIQYIINR